ncbi:hypothetical protein HU200_000280 [Digitaria exilis]|uniref:Lipoxygenase n=1 Tax=Digitaria exilis TaxID=1010633 RepID=A0A835KVT4_9POAL|nr:hypothetical protein HU200_000280 [Digitaria exilis]
MASCRATRKATVRLQLKEADSTNPAKVADMASQPWLFIDMMSSELDPRTGEERYTNPQEAKYSHMDRTFFIYEATFTVPSSFGPIGAIMVENRYNAEVYVSDVEVVQPKQPGEPSFVFHCDSWITFNPQRPSTPTAMQTRRQAELDAIRGNGHGERVAWERVYDYDVYNDLGDPDTDTSAKRPVLGGEERPYLRRCKTDHLSETRVVAAGGDIYVPRDEAFTERKAGAFMTKKFFSGLSAFTTRQKVSDDKRRSFPSLAAIDALYEDGYRNQPSQEAGNELDYMDMLKKQVQRYVMGEKEEALAKNKLFMLDYHDKFLPYVNKVRELDDTTLYASRTVLFLTEDGTLRPIAIELTRPKSKNLPQWRQVFTPGSSMTDAWLWQLAKTHVLAHDTGYHQLVSHWLRTHCCVEPYIIAAHRQLSEMHPIYRLLHPHFRFTMEINAQARGMLISAGGFIESSFSPGKLSMELSSGIYDRYWRFDMEALPADLVRRGMAFERNDGTLQLTVEDYPYANDGMLVWDSIKEWVSDYVWFYYTCASEIARDVELQAFWTEVRTKGHEDKQHETWWPTLDCHESLVHTLTTIIWVASGHHAAVNFGQYPYAGYFPNRPTIARRNMPTECKEAGGGCEEEMRLFEQDPVKVLLDTFPSQYQSTLVLPVLNLLSSHSPGEEYMGTHAEPAWMAEPEVRAAFLRFNARMMEIAETIDRRNKDKELKNRHGPGVVPYVLLKPNYGDPKDMTSVMEMGIPNSISI